MDIGSLRKAVHEYYINGLAPSTHKVYHTGQQRYLSFCHQARLIAVPTTEATLLLFLAFLAKDGLAYTTIKVYLAAISNLHTTAGLHNIYSQQLTPYLEQVVQGIKKEQLRSRPPRIRLPITTEIMSRIHNILARSPNDHQSIMMWAACCTAFFGFLRCSEFTIASPNDFDPAAHLSINDIAVDNRNSPSLLRVTIKQSKTDPFRKGVQIFLGRTGKAICPVTAILPYLAIRGNTEGLLFITKTGRPLTRQHFSSALTTILQTAGLQAEQYNTHSFRIGAATSAKQSGISDLHIKMLGRWQSSAYETYIKTPRSQLADFSKQLVAPL